MDNSEYHRKEHWPEELEPSVKDGSSLTPVDTAPECEEHGDMYRRQRQEAGEGPEDTDMFVTYECPHCGERKRQYE